MIIDIYKILFEENFTPSVFFFLMGLIATETYLLIRLNREHKLSNAVIIGITGVSLFFSIALLARPNSITEKYDNCYQPQFNGNGCMSEALKNEDPSGDFFFNTITFNHYFEGKDIVICDDVASKDEIVAYLGAFSSASSINISKEYASGISKEVINILEDEASFIEKDSRKYMLDKTWKRSQRIVGTSIDGNVYFMSEELFKDALNNDCDKDFLSETDKELTAVEYMNSQRGERSINQMALLLIFFVVGFIPCSILFKGKMKILNAFLSLPVGLSVTTLIGVVLIVLGIPFRRLILIGLFAIVLAVEIIFAIKNRVCFNLKTVIKIISSAIVMDIIIVELKLFRFCTDSAYKMWCAYLLAEGKAAKSDMLATCLPWGLMEPIIHAIGWKFKSDIVYGIYLGTFICSIGIIVSAAYYLAKKDNKVAMVALSFLCAGLFASNNDAFVIGIWAHGNGPTGCMILSMLVVIYISMEKNIPTKWLATLLGFAIVVTRVEGGIYVCLLLLLLCGICKEKEYTVLNIVMAFEIFLWQIITMIIASGHIAESDEEYWTPEKGIILITLSVVTIGCTLLMRTDNKIIKYVKTNYYKIAIITGIMISIIMYIIKPDIAYSTAKVFVRHFATSKMSNSGVLWSFVLLMTPLLLMSKKKKARFLIAFIADYILLQFLIYCVRDQADPIHILIGDSCRRTLQQILSTTMLMIPLIWNELFDGKRKILEGN